MARREDKELARLMDQFVCVRIVQAWGMDLTLFQYDWRQTWAVFLMNANKAIYGRFSARQVDDIEGLRKALEGALELHKKYPANKADLAGKVGPPLAWKTPEEIPYIRDRGKYQKAEGSKHGCIHCHNVIEGMTKSLKDQAIPERITAPYPNPQRVGLMLDSRERATVTDVQSGSPADKAGFQAGDKVLRFGGQPLLSTADFAWVLWASDGPTLKAEIDRGGQKVEATLTLPSGWRTK